MKKIRSLLGRRQFLITAGAVSASALTLKKHSKMTSQMSQYRNDGNASDSFSNIAVAGEKTGSAGKRVTTNKYPHLLSPLKIRNRVLKNRILHTRSTPHQLQGPENYPNEMTKTFYRDAAKNAAIVSLHPRFPEKNERGQVPDIAAAGLGAKDERGTQEEGMLHFPHWDDIPLVHNYFDQLIEGIHIEGSMVALGDVDGNTIEEVVTQAKKVEQKGYDVVRVGSHPKISSKTLHEDIEKMQAVRNATNLIVLAMLRPFTPGLSVDTQGDEVTGPELEEVVKIAKMLEGSADILQMKDAGGASNHPNSFSMERDKPMMLRFSEAIKESGAKIITCPTGGFHYPELNEQWIASGKADMIGMATPFIADPEYVQKAWEGRAEDIVPCVRCHDCHGINMTVGPWFNICTVNPKFGLSGIEKRSISPPSASKKVAIVGGGPGGMKAAITAAERGHKVTLFEKSDSLGGQQRHVDLSQWKWAYKDFKDYLILQVHKAGIDVQLNTTATPDIMKSKGYDTVIVATGAEPVVSRIPGGDGKNVYNVMDVYSNKKSLGKNVVIIGAGVFGTETGCCLVKDGYKVTVLTSGNKLIEDEFIGPHNKRNQIHIYRNHPNFSYFLEVTATRIAEGKVFYKNAAGKENSVPADSIVIYAGFKPRMDEAMAFLGSAGQVLLVGDCTGKAGTIQKTIRSAYFTACQV